MEKKELEKLFEEVRTLSLTGQERALVRQRMAAFMKDHPVRNAADARLLEWAETILHKPISLKLKYVMPILLILALLASGGGVSYAAQGSLPGEVLYPVKVDINEPVAGLFHVSSQAKAEWNAGLAQTRLQEAEQLAAQNKLNPQLQAQVTQRLQDAVTATQSDVAQLTQQNQVAVAAQINSDLETSLRVHAAILARLASAHQDQGDIHDVIDAAVEQAQRIADNGDQLDASTIEQIRANGPEAQSAVANKRDEVRSFVDEVAGLFKDQGASLNATSSAAVQASLTLAQQKIAAGDTASQAGKYAEAFADYQDAQQAAQDAKIQIVTSHTLKIEFDEEDSATSSDKNEPERENEHRNQDQGVNASTSERNQEVEQHQDRNASSTKHEDSNDATDAELQLNASGTTIHVGD